VSHWHHEEWDYSRKLRLMILVVLIIDVCLFVFAA
jgi:hypothetical protein